MFHKSNQTPISRTMGLMSMVCPICGSGFARYASKVRKAEVCCCSRACAAKAREVRISIRCVVCDETVELIPSSIGRVTTCSKKCSGLRRRSANPNARSLRRYKDTVDQIAARQHCQRCEKTHGPFVVKDLVATFEDDGELTINDTDAKLWCRHCHLESIALAGGTANGARFTNSDGI